MIQGEKRDKQLHTTLSESELAEMDSLVEQRRQLNNWVTFYRSDFVREAIFEKIQRERSK